MTEFIEQHIDKLILKLEWGETIEFVFDSLNEKKQWTMTYSDYDGSCGCIGFFDNKNKILDNIELIKQVVNILYNAKYGKYNYHPPEIHMVNEDFYINLKTQFRIGEETYIHDDKISFNNDINDFNNTIRNDKDGSRKKQYVIIQNGENILTDNGFLPISDENLENACLFENKKDSENKATEIFFKNIDNKLINNHYESVPLSVIEDVLNKTRDHNDVSTLRM